MQNKTTEIFRDAPVPKAVISNVVPSIISMIMVLIYNPADTFFIGQTKSAYMVAAISAAAQPITEYLSTALAAALFLFAHRKYFPKADSAVSGTPRPSTT